jgi:hypothetical protein
LAINFRHVLRDNSGSGVARVIPSIVSYVIFSGPKRDRLLRHAICSDQVRGALPVAFQQFNQTKAFYADSIRADDFKVAMAPWVWGGHFAAVIPPVCQRVRRRQFLGATFGT